LQTASPDRPAVIIADPNRRAGPDQTSSFQPIDLSSYPVDLEVVAMLSEEECRQGLFLAVGKTTEKLLLAMANPADAAACQEIANKTGLEVEPLAASEREIAQAIERVYAKIRQRAQPSIKQAPALSAAQPAEPLPVPAHVDELLNILIERRGSDLHMTVGSPPIIRVDGQLVALSYQRLTPTVMQELIYSILTDDRVERYEREWELDFAYSVPGLCRFRVNVHRQRNTTGAVFRAVPVNPPSLDDLRMPKVLKSICQKPRGLVLVTGPTGSGKSTTLAAMVREINYSRRCHVVTIEDPIEFLHRNQESIIRQREVGSDTHSFANALRHVLRQDPDVILIGEMRDLETISAAVTAAETGHLVFATLHTTGAAQTVDRVIDVFPPYQQEQIRLQLSTVLEAVVCQTLLPLVDGKGRVCAQEIMIATSAIRNLIREGKTHQMNSVVQSGGEFGMQTLNQVLRDLVLNRMVVFDVAVMASPDPDELRGLVGRGHMM